ncbi:hypothetical protein TMSI_06800 [Klebsiella quasipneumoniae]|nr:hypothetical protein TMSI_06800 [Klebsiella quasipneumoniae]
MLQQSVTCAVGLIVGTTTGINVVIHFNITNTVFINQPGNNPIGVFLNQGMAEIKLITLMVNNSFTMALEKAFIRKFLCQSARNTYDLKLQPQAWFHAFCSNIIDGLSYPAWKARN